MTTPAEIFGMNLTAGEIAAIRLSADEIAAMRLRARIRALQQVVGELSINAGSRESYAEEIREFTLEAEELATRLLKYT